MRVEVAGKPVNAPKLWEAAAKINQPGRKIKQLVICMLPVKPGQDVVLTVGVVVARLRAAEFVAALQHWYPLRQEERGQQGTLQVLAVLENHRVVAFAFSATVPGKVVSVPIVVVFSVELVVLVLIADQIA